MTAANDERDNIDRVANGPMGDGQIDPVAREDACPDCGERECDELALDTSARAKLGIRCAIRATKRHPPSQGLVWLDDVHVECQRCKTVYRPGRKNAPPA
jgi:hypothetical protein